MPVLNETHTNIYTGPRLHIVNSKVELMLEKAEKRFLAHIRVLSFWIAFWIKRGYDSEKAEKAEKGLKTFSEPYPRFILLDSLLDKTRI